MAAVELWEHLFKPEARKKGTEDFQRERVSFKAASDTEIVAYVRSGTGCKVLFRAGSIAHPVFHVSCSCASGLRGSFCKHIFATLLAAEIRHPDFFDSKKDVEIETADEGRRTEPGPQVSRAKAGAARPDSEATIAYKAKAKAKQADYRKHQYEKQKARKDSLRKSASKAKVFNQEVLIPDGMKRALDYFSGNGFPLAHPIDEIQLKNAMKKLARIFHPDVGGTHEETVTLNQNYEIILKFIL